MALSPPTYILQADKAIWTISVFQLYSEIQKSRLCIGIHLLSAVPWLGRASILPELSAKFFIFVRLSLLIVS